MPGECGPGRSAAYFSVRNESAAKRSILAFVQSVTDQKGPDYVAPAGRIAVFDNDGTLWSEQPFYIQLAFRV